MTGIKENRVNLSDRISLSQQKRDTLLCLGLDPDPSRHGAKNTLEDIQEFLLGAVDLTRDEVCGYKANLAFYLAFGADGLKVLRSLRAAIPSDSLFILDAKWNDVGHTVERYASFTFDYLGADIVTVNPYLGLDGIAPFIREPSRGVFLLCRTSNPNGAEVQMFPSQSNSLFMHIAQLAKQWNRHKNIGLVIGATFPEEIKAIRTLVQDLFFLTPGVGAQGGSMDEVMSASGDKVVIPMSRSLLYPEKEQAEANRVLEAVQKANAVLRGLRS